MSTEIPKFHELFIPALTVLSASSPLRSREIVTGVADLLQLSEEQRRARIPSGQARLANRVHWALSYLFQAGAVAKPGRGIFAVNERGSDLLTRYPNGLKVRDLEQFEEFREFLTRNSGRDSGSPETSIDDEESTPLELAAEATDKLNRQVAAEIIARLRASEPEFLERMLLPLLARMGYGGTSGRLEHSGGVHDGGFDGIINQDHLGIDRIYLQAKRYKEGSNIGRPEVQGFLGALHHAGAAGGIFVTTSDFSSGAVEFARSASPRIVLINGTELGRLMVEHGVGVQERQVFTVVEIDEDFFDDQA